MTAHDRAAAEAGAAPPEDDDGARPSPEAGRAARLAGHAARRLPVYGLVLLVVVTLNFALPRLMPGDPTLLVLGDDAGLLSDAELAQARERLGLDKPVAVQYATYLGDLAQGDLGYSFRRNRPVTDLLGARLPWTLLLVGLSVVLSAVVGVAAGTLAAWRRGRRTDTAALTGFLILDALPAFWVGLLLLIVFAVTLGAAPSFGATTPGAGLSGMAWLGDVAAHLALPLATLTLASLGAMFLISRYSLLGVVRADHVLVARATGVSESAIALRHALPAASLPIVTVVLLRLGFLVSGAVVVEQLFTYPGVGRLILEAALGRDYPVMQGAFFVLAVAVIAANALADLLYPLCDPRVGERERSGR